VPAFVFTYLSKLSQLSAENSQCRHDPELRLNCWQSKVDQCEVDPDGQRSDHAGEEDEDRALVHVSPDPEYKRGHVQRLFEAP
jgi:hypothetical protein